MTMRVRRNGTMLPMHFANRNGVPARSGPFRTLWVSPLLDESTTVSVQFCLQTIRPLFSYRPGLVAPLRSYVKLHYINSLDRYTYWPTVFNVKCVNEACSII